MRIYSLTPDIDDAFTANGALEEEFISDNFAMATPPAVDIIIIIDNPKADNAILTVVVK